MRAGGVLRVWALGMSVAVGGCNQTAKTGESVSKSSSALSTTATRIYGFESLSDWSAVSSSPTFALSSTHVEGAKSLAVSGGGWSSFRSAATSKEQAAPTVFGFDLQIPTTQPNPDWYGTVELFVDAPSVGVNNQSLGLHQLKEWTPGQWKRAEYGVPTAIRTALGGNYTDLRFRIQLNVPTNSLQPYLFDRLTFGAIGSGCTPQNDGNPCTSDQCDANNNPVHVLLPAGTSCSDGNVCNGAETCSATGTCTAGTPPSLNDNNVCTTDACTAATGITHTPVAAGTSCTDGNVCNGAETCSATGTCTAGTPPSLNDNNACTTDACTSGTGITHTPVPAGTSCSDNNVCNGAEICSATGTCNAGTPLVVDDGNPCTTDACSATTGVSHTPVAAGTSCADSNACNGTEKCNATGTCNPGAPPTLDDSNPCTADACTPATGVTHTPVAVGTSCSDGNACNGAEACNASGVCAGGIPPVVDDGNPCTADKCTPATGVEHTVKLAGTSCSDGNVCNGVELCNATGVCTPGTPLALDDLNPCTVDSCNATAGVQHQPVPAGTSCSDGAACNGAETCDPWGQCQLDAGTCNPNTCTASTLKLLKVHADFADILAGRETEATGKRTSKRPKIVLDFNEPVDPQRISAIAVGHVAGTKDAPRECLGSWEPATLDILSIDGVMTGADAWELSSPVDATSLKVPLDFDAVTFGDMSANPSIDGPVAVGGNATFSSFSLNTSSGSATGIIVGGTLKGTNGTIHGSIAYGGPVPVLQNVNVTGGTTAGLPFSFGTVHDALAAFATNLASRGATGVTTLSGPNLTFTGSNTPLNVFTIDAAGLAQARSISIVVPNGAAALINVTGTSVSVTNAGTTVSGVAPTNLLWNMASATTLTLGSVDFRGSVLAPGAATTFVNGTLTGTIVASSATGPMHIVHAPLTSWAAFGPPSSTNNHVVLQPNRSLFGGCSYELIVDVSPMNAAGHCLAQPFKATFVVSDNSKAAFEREMGSRTFNARLPAPVAFKSNAGINTPIEDVFERYAETLGIRSVTDSLHHVRDGLSPINDALSSAFFRQEYQGLRVGGYGYMVQHESGIFRSATGRLFPDLALDVKPTITSASAIDTAVNGVHPLKKPWTETPPSGPAPSTELMIAIRGTPELPVPTLVWRVTFKGVPEARSVDVDAKTGALLGVRPGVLEVSPLLPPIGCTGFQPDVAVLDGYDTRDDVSIDFTKTDNETRDGLVVGRFKQGGITYQALRNWGVPFIHRTDYLDANVSPGTNSDNYIEVLCDTPSVQEGRTLSGVHWATQDAARSFAQFTYKGTHWQGLTGPDDSRSLVVHYIVPTPDQKKNEDNHWNSHYNEWAPEDKGEESFTVVGPDAFPGTVAHEFGHGVMRNTQDRNGGVGVHYELESGALMEAYGDIMAAVTAATQNSDLDLDFWCIAAAYDESGACERDLRSPDKSAGATGPSPSTYGVGLWKKPTPPCVRDNDYCGVHSNSTVASHWFYTLVNGQDASTLNDLGCGVSVPPLDPDLHTSLLMAGQIVFQAWGLLPEDATMADAYDLTSAVVDDLEYGDDAKVAVQKAWLSVGVNAGDPPKPPHMFPENKATNVDFWPGLMRWSVDGEAGPWIARYSTHKDFSDAQEVEVISTFEQDGHTWAYIPGFDLPGDTKIYWQGREGDLGPPDAWTNCNTWSASFTTSSHEIVLTNPAQESAGGYYELDEYGLVNWRDVLMSLSYEARLTENESDCGPDDSTFLIEPFAAVGDTIDKNSQMSKKNIPLIGKDIDLDPNKTYHLYIRAKRNDVYGVCSHFPVRKKQLKPFQLLSPLANPLIPTLGYDSGGPFVFTPSAGALSYDIVVQQVVDGHLMEVLRENASADLIPTDGDGNLTYTLQNHGPTIQSNSDKQYWEVWAKGDGVERPAWDPGNPGFTNLAQFFVAPEKITQVYPQTGQPQGSTTLSVRLVQDGPRLEDFQVVPRHNSVGVAYAIGHGDTPGPDDTFYGAYPSDDIGGNFLIDDAYLPDDEMTLWIIPFSTLFEGDPQPYGFGEMSTFHIQVEICGEESGICCDDGVCAGGLGCYNGHCQAACGKKAGWDCCEDNTCVDADLLYCGSDHKCHHCGDPGEYCCELGLPGGNVCNGKADCFSDQKCHSCGDDNLQCCPNDSCPWGQYNCHQGKCQPAVNDAPTAHPCNQEVHVGANDGGVYHVDVGANHGKVWFTVNTLEVPDSMVVSYEGTTERITDCVGTSWLPNICSDQLDPPQLPIWCCDNGTCQTQIAFSGNDSIFDVEVTPNCSGPGDTVWGFTISCVP